MRQSQPNSVLTMAPIVAFVALCSAVGSASASDFPYYGVVTAETVDVQAGAGMNYYKAGELRRGDVVEVHNHFHHWFKIAPPPGVFSYVKTAFVVRSGDGATGTVTRDGVIVKTAALDGPPGLSYRQQRFLREGEQVFIVAEAGDFFKILPPIGAFVFLAPETVAPATVEQVAAAGLVDQPQAANPDPDLQADVATTVTDTKVSETVHEAATDGGRAAPAAKAPAAAPARFTPQVHEPVVARLPDRVALQQNPAPVAVKADGRGDDVAVMLEVPAEFSEPAPALPDRSAPAADPVATVSTAPAVRLPTPAARSPIPIEANSPLVVLAERKLQFASLHPLHKQPIERLMKAYADLSRDKTLSRSDRYLVRTRLLQLAQRQHLAETLQDVSNFLKDHRRPTDELAFAAPARVPRYAAVGKLVSSLVYDGQTLPMMYRVVEPGSFRTLAYVRPGTDGHAAKYLGRLVGVIGEPRFDDSFKAMVVEAVRVDLLEPIEQNRTTSVGRCLLGPMQGRQI